MGAPACVEPAALASPDFGTTTNEYGNLAPSEQIGTYEVIAFSRDGDRAQFDEASSYFCGEAGFAYLPDGNLTVILGGDGATWVELGDGWYAFDTRC